MDGRRWQTMRLLSCLHKASTCLARAARSRNTPHQTASASARPHTAHPTSVFADSTTKQSITAGHGLCNNWMIS